MQDVTLRPVTQENWRDTFGLTVQPEQVRFGPDFASIPAIALAKAYVGYGGVSWTPYAIYAGGSGLAADLPPSAAEMVGFVALAYEPGSSDEYWIFHFLIDQRFQGRGYGKAALERLIERVKHDHPRCRMLQLVVHPENQRAQQLYVRVGFRATGTQRWSEPVYRLALQ
jgi:diamine N-acetyltransferase